MWFVRVGSHVSGPFTEKQLRAMRARGEFSPIHQISTDGKNWESAAELVESFDGRAPVLLHAEEQAPAPADALAQSAADNPKSNASNGSAEWYYLDSARRQVGPIPDEKLWSLYHTGRVTGRTLVCKASEGQWVAARRHPDLAPLAPSKSWRLPAAALAAAFLVCLLAGFFVVRHLLRERDASASNTVSESGNPSETGGSAEHSDTPNRDVEELVTSLEDTQRIKSAVGLVVCGWTVTPKPGKGDGETIQQSSGSCFSVSADGYLITDKHLLKEIAIFGPPMQPKDRIKAFSDLLAPDGAKRRAEWGKTAIGKRLSRERSKYNLDTLQDVYPEIWVFFGSANEKFDAEIVPFNSRDVSILKIKRKAGPSFRVADSRRMPKHGMKVYALGFRYVVPQALVGKDARQLAQVELNTIDPIEAQLSGVDFDYRATNGKVRGILTVTDNDLQINHSALLEPGTFGGPLVTEDATVVGINIQASKGEVDATQMDYTTAMPPLRDEIEKAIQKHRKPSSF